MSAISPTAHDLLKSDPFEHETIIAEGLSYEEFLRQFDGQHAEWFEGKAILVMANSSKHQLILGFLYILFWAYFEKTPVGKHIFAPFSTRMLEGLPHREPDMLIILNDNLERLQTTRLEGAADVVIEVVSEESIERDYYTKFQEYEQAGVQEYWIIDPLREVVSIHILNENGKYRYLPYDEQGRFFSTLLPFFAINPDVLWRENLPSSAEIMTLIQRMTAENGE